MIRRLVLGLLSPAMVVLVLLAGCAKHPSADRALDHLRMQAEERLLQDARAMFFQGKYQETTLLLDRFLTHHPRSQLTDEARWWLARAQQQYGDLDAALMRYRQLAQSRHRNPYRDEATLRVQELELIVGVNPESDEPRGVVVGALVLLQPNGLDMISDLRDQSSADVVAIDVPCGKPSTSENPENSSPSGSKIWNRILDEGITPLVTLGKERGFGVLLRIPLRCMGNYLEASDVQARRWRDQIYDTRSGHIEPSEAYSLFSAEYRDVVFSRLAQVAELRVAGVVFRATATQGPYEGFNALAVREFEQQFGEPVTPELIFEARSGGETDLSSDRFNQRVSVSVDHPPLFWKWMGWKAREGFRHMNEMAVQLRSQFPYLKIGLELHAESIEDPLAALVNVSEDWVEMSHGEFDMIVTDTQNLLQERGQIGMADLNESATTRRTSDLVKRMVEYVRNPERVWIIQAKSQFLTSPNQTGQLETELPKGVGILYDHTLIP